MTQDIEKAKVLYMFLFAFFFLLFFLLFFETQFLEIARRVLGNETVITVEKDTLREHLSPLDLQKSVG